MRQKKAKQSKTKPVYDRSENVHIVKPMERGQITLPKVLRDAVGITSDTWLWLTLTDDNRISIEPVRKANTDIIPAKSSPKEALAKFDKQMAGKPLWTAEDDERLSAARKNYSTRFASLYGKE